MKKLKFSKYQGLGNDFILLEEKVVKGLDYSHLAKSVCDRHFGIGADGMAIIKKIDNKWTMPFFNADGSEAPMCGNASRCVADYLQKYHNQEDSFVLVTKGANLYMSFIEDEVSVNLGEPKFSSQDVPISWSGKDFISQEIEVLDKKVEISALFMTTSHSVIIIKSFKDIDLKAIGRAVENHYLFPEKINVNFIVIKNRGFIKQKTWERGVGMTLACGTGASASVALAHKLSLVDDYVKVEMDGGSLSIKVTENNEVIMQGKVSEIACGEYFYKEEI
ncbi:MAG: diaminopimelate epimerase [Clostridia bacterium]